MDRKISADNKNESPGKYTFKGKTVNLEELDAQTLKEILNYEIDMICFGKSNMDIIEKCSERLCKASKQMLTEEQIIGIIQKTQSENVDII